MGPRRPRAFPSADPQRAGAAPALGAAAGPMGRRAPPWGKLAPGKQGNSPHAHAPPARTPPARGRRLALVLHKLRTCFAKPPFVYCRAAPRLRCQSGNSTAVEGRHVARGRLALSNSWRLPPKCKVAFSCMPYGAHIKFQICVRLPISCSAVGTTMPSVAILTMAVAQFCLSIRLLNAQRRYHAGTFVHLALSLSQPTAPLLVELPYWQL